MNPRMFYFEMLNDLMKDYQEADKYEEAFAVTTAIDLWDGMTKGKGSESFAFYVDAIKRNQDRGTTAETEAYQEVLTYFHEIFSS